MTEPSPPAQPTFSLIVPVYGNEDTIDELLEAISGVHERCDGDLEAIFVVDASPDASEERLRAALPHQTFPSMMVVHSRNFGAFQAIRTGLGHARGRYAACMAADLQEPIELVESFFRILVDDKADVVVGVREGRDDPGASAVAAGAFWRVYRRMVQPEMPAGGVDMFGCTRRALDALLSMREAHGSLVGLLIWMGFRRTEVPYERVARPSGKSGWTLRKKLRYMSDSIYSFTDLPIRLLLTTGLFGSILTVVSMFIVFGAWLLGWIDVPGYAPLMLSTLLVGTLILVGLGVVGSYVWRTFENTKARPLSLVQRIDHHPGMPQ
jgi:glycosyltransferase involved in cell wall biosynthesis